MTMPVEAATGFKRDQPITALMSTEEKQKLHDYSRNSGITMSQIVRESVASYIEEQNPHLPRTRRRRRNLRTRD